MADLNRLVSVSLLLSWIRMYGPVQLSPPIMLVVMDAICGYLIATLKEINEAQEYISSTSLSINGKCPSCGEDMCLAVFEEAPSGVGYAVPSVLYNKVINCSNCCIKLIIKKAKLYIYEEWLSARTK